MRLGQPPDRFRRHRKRDERNHHQADMNLERSAGRIARVLRHDAGHSGTEPEPEPEGKTGDDRRPRLLADTRVIDDERGPHSQEAPDGKTLQDPPEEQHLDVGGECHHQGCRRDAHHGREHHLAPADPVRDTTHHEHRRHDGERVGGEQQGHLAVGQVEVLLVERKQRRDDAGAHREDEQCDGRGPRRAGHWPPLVGTPSLVRIKPRTQRAVPVRARPQDPARRRATR